MSNSAKQAALGLLFAAMYALFRTRNYYWDGISFAIDIEHAQSWRELFQVHHLLYNFIGYAAYKLAGGGVRALYLMQWTNCAAGGLLVWLASRFFRSLEVPPANSLACAALVGVSATFWRFATDADSYILANVFLAGAWLALRRPSWVLGGLLHLCAMMMHQLSALFYPVGLALLWQHSRKNFRRATAGYTLICAGGTLAIYEMAYRLSLRQTAPSFAQWLTFHAAVPFSFNLVKDAGWLVLGNLRLLLGGRWSATAVIAAPVALALLIWGIAGLVRRGRWMPVLCEWPLLFWLAVYTVFLFAWEPYNTFYRLFYLLPLVALLGLGTRAASARPLLCLAAALAWWNFSQFIYPNTRIENNNVLAFALEYGKQWPRGTGIIFSQFVPDLWTISYFNPQVSWIPLVQPESARLEAIKSQFAREGRDLYVDWTYLQKTGHPAGRFTFERVGLR